MNKNQLKSIVKEEYQNVKSFMEDKYGFTPELGKVISNPYANSFVNEAKEPEVITTLRKIVKDKQNNSIKDIKSGKKVRVDMNSANLMVQVYDALKKQSNKDKFVKSGIVMMGHMAYKLMKKESVNEAFVVLYSPKKGVKPVTTAAYRHKKDAEKWAKDLGGITMIVKKKMKGVDESVDEAKLSTIHKAAKKGSYPVSIVATMLGKVVKQELVKTPMEVPAAFNMMQGGYPRATIAVEDRHGKVLFKEATFVPNSGTMSGGVLKLDNKKYQLKKDVKNVQIGNYTNIVLPKGTILYNIPGGLFADHKSLEQYADRNQKYFKKPTFKGISIRQKPDTIKDVEKNSKVLESVNKSLFECWDTHKQVGMKMKNGKQVPNCVPKNESMDEGMFSAIDLIRQNSKDASDFIKNVFKDKDFKDMKNDKEFLKYLKSIFEGFSSDAQRKAAFANGYEEKGKKKESIEEYDVENEQDIQEFVEFMKEYKSDINEGEYQGRDVKLGKIMQGDVKKFKVYVKNPKGNVVKVNFGHKGKGNEKTMSIKKNNPERRKAFRARHNCDNPGPRHKARYWSCKKW